MNPILNFKKEIIIEILNLTVGKPFKITSDFIRNSVDNVIGNDYQCGIDCYCSKCKDTKTFIISSSTFYQKAFDFIRSIKESSFKSVSLSGGSKTEPSSLFASEKGKFDVELKCPVCNETIYFYYVYEKGCITKINTYPNLMNGLKQKFRKYEALNNDDFNYNNELITGCYLFYNSNSGIGSFCYLRRCLENFVKDYTNDLYDEGIITNKYNPVLKFEDKIGIIENELDKDIYDMLKPLYSILSLGIHELKEQDCLDIFEQVKDILEILLDERIEKINKKNKIQKLKKNLYDNNSKLLNQKSS